MAPDTQYFAICFANEAGTGTVTLVATSADVVGSGTNFLTYHAGDTIVVTGEEHTVSFVTDNTHLTTVLPWGQSASGAAFTHYLLTPTIEDHTEGGHVAVVFPRPIYMPYTQPLDLGDGSLRGGGWATAEWQWDILTRDQREALRAYMPATVPSVAPTSALVRFRTSVNEENDVFVTFLGQMLWPPGETKDATARKPFSLKFRALVDLS